VWTEHCGSFRGLEPRHEFGLVRTWTESFSSFGQRFVTASYSGQGAAPGFGPFRLVTFTQASYTRNDTVHVLWPHMLKAINDQSSNLDQTSATLRR
jgi:hypothetical protein